MTSVAKRKQINTTFGSRLRSLREAAGLTQTELATKAELTYQEVSKYERGKREPTFTTLLQLAAALGVELNKFQAEVGQSPGDEPQVEEPPTRAMGKRK